MTNYLCFLSLRSFHGVGDSLKEGCPKLDIKRGFHADVTPLSNKKLSMAEGRWAHGFHQSGPNVMISLDSGRDFGERSTPSVFMFPCLSGRLSGVMETVT